MEVLLQILYEANNIKAGFKKMTWKDPKMTWKDPKMTRKMTWKINKKTWKTWNCQGILFSQMGGNPDPTINHRSANKRLLTIIPLID